MAGATARSIGQAGLRPVRADGEHLRHRKDHGSDLARYQSASVLVAEMTTKNANVFYEHGLAHALEKPVVFVPSEAGFRAGRR